MDTNVFNPYVSTSLEDGIFHVCLVAPRVGDHEASIIAAAVHRTLREHGRSLRTMVLDVSNVQMMQSVGLGMCIDIRNTADAFGVSTRLVGLRGRLAQLFRLLKIDRLFTIESGSAATPRTEVAGAA